MSSTSRVKDVEGQVRVGDRSVRYVLRRPAMPGAERQGLMINLSADRFMSIDQQPYCITSDVLLNAGHAVASFDLPHHGDDGDPKVEGLTGMAAAVRAGIDVFERVALTGRAVIDACLPLLPAGAPGAKVVIAGTSRGGLSAFHVMAADRRVLAGAGLAPVTHIPALREFADLSDSPIIKRSNAAALVPRLAGRPIFIAINRIDARVDADKCFAFVESLKQAGGDTVSLRVEPGEDHSMSDAGHRAGGEFLLGVLNRS